MSVGSLSIPEWSVRDMVDRELYLVQRPYFSVNVSFKAVNWIMTGAQARSQLGRPPSPACADPRASQPVSVLLYHDPSATFVLFDTLSSC
jgi:hypothetical protein